MPALGRLLHVGLARFPVVQLLLGLVLADAVGVLDLADELDKIAGKREQLLGKIQNSYGIGKDEAEKQIKDWGTRQHGLDVE